MTVEDDVKRLVNETITSFGRIDVVVNSAGEDRFSKIRDEVIMKDFDFVFNLNLRSCLHLIHLTVPYLEKSKGTIINISSYTTAAPVMS